MTVYLNREGETRPTQWKSLTAVRRWATRCDHVWRNDGDVVVVSTAEGAVLRYAAQRAELAPAGA